MQSSTSDFSDSKNKTQNIGRLLFDVEDKINK